MTWIWPIRSDQTTLRLKKDLTVVNFNHEKNILIQIIWTDLSLLTYHLIQSVNLFINSINNQ